MSKLEFISVLLLFILCFTACKEQKTGSQLHRSNDTPFLLSIEEAMNLPETDVMMSDYVGKIEYIPLELTDSSAIHPQFITVYPLSDYILVRNENKPVFLFNYEGKFVRSIGTIGRGPGEYGKHYQIAFDDVNKHLFVLNDLKDELLTFDLEGRFLKKTRIPKDVSSLAYLGGDRFLLSLRRYALKDDLQYNYVIVNLDGSIVKTYRIPGESYRRYPIEGTEYSQAADLSPLLKQTSDGAILYTAQNDSLIHFDKTGLINFPLIWDGGKYRSPYFPMDLSVEKREKEKYISFYMVDLYEDIAFVSFTYQRQNFQLLCHLRKNEVLRIRNVVNDLDGGPSFTPNMVIGRNKNRYANVIRPIFARKELDEGSFDSEIVKNPEARKDFIKMIRELPEDANPVIMLVTMK